MGRGCETANVATSGLAAFPQWSTGHQSEHLRLERAATVWSLGTVSGLGLQQGLYIWWFKKVPSIISQFCGSQA